MLKVYVVLCIIRDMHDDDDDKWLRAWKKCVCNWFFISFVSFNYMWIVLDTKNVTANQEES